MGREGPKLSGSDAFNVRLEALRGVGRMASVGSRRGCCIRPRPKLFALTVPIRSATLLLVSEATTSAISHRGLVEARDLVRRYRVDEEWAITALDGVSLKVDMGSVVAVAGPSGSGKSTLLHVIGGLERPDEGRIVVGGRELGELGGRELASYRRGIGFVFQRFHLLPALTAIDNVMAPVLPYRTDFDKTGRAGELLATVGLAGRESSLPSRLSGGEQQRVAIARALINQPELVLADEPTGNLDSRTGAEIVELLSSLRERAGVTVLVATHDPQVAARCDRVVCLRDGRVVDDVVVVPGTDVGALLGRIPSPSSP